MRKMVCLLLAAMLLPLFAAAEGLSLTPRPKGFGYAFTANTEWTRLTWKSGGNRGSVTLYGPGGRFGGQIDLPYDLDGGKYTVTVTNLALKELYKANVNLPAAPGYAAPSGRSNAAVKNFSVTATATGFKYSFMAPGTDYMVIAFRSVQEAASFPVYPVNGEGLYEGEVVSPASFARDQYTVQVCNGKGNVRKEVKVRKDYAATAAPEAEPGRLSGVTVCIDPGHHENHQHFTEDKGPGLSGRVVNTGGMAQGVKTLRREHIITLEVGMLLRDLLIREGATVVMTREKPDDFRTNIGRCDIAAQADAQLILRLHCDLVESRPNKTGIQVYCPRNSTYAKAVASAEDYRAAGQAFLDEMKKAAGKELSDKTGAVHLNDDYVGNNWAKMMCFLVEMGYMSNVGEDYLLSAPEYQRMLAKGMAEGVYQVALLQGWIRE